jgi:protein tyrosine phosphatase (PTP) superfamily phosphohydrolase (DUF442 family)
VAPRGSVRGRRQLPQALAVMSSVSVHDVYNFRQAAPDVATSGQPTEEQLGAIAAAGYNVVVNLALHDDPRYSLRDEAASVRAFGLDYVHIPVQFGAPKEEDLLAFFDAMDRNSGRRVWIHCAANMRVTAFVGLYRVLRLGWTEGDAFSLMRTVWKPDHI